MLIQKIRKILGWLSVLGVIGVLIVVVTAKQETVAQGVVISYTWFILGMVVTGVWFFSTVYVKVSMIEGVKPNRIINFFSILMFAFTIYVAKNSPDDGTRIVVSDSLKYFSAAALLIQPIVDLLDSVLPVKNRYQ